MAFSPKSNNMVKQTVNDIMNIKRMTLQDKNLGVPLLLQHTKWE